MEDKSLEKIDIEKIMEEIRQEIKDKGYKETDLSFEDIPIQEVVPQQNNKGNYDSTLCSHALSVMNDNYAQSVCIPISGGNPVAVFIKKVIRKITKFLFYPVIMKQNDFNSGAVQFGMQVTRHMAEMEQENNARIAQIEMLEQKIEQLQETIDQLQGK